MALIVAGLIPVFLAKSLCVIRSIPKIVDKYILITDSSPPFYVFSIMLSVIEIY